jgi:predicted nucleic acid-binding protein
MARTLVDSSVLVAFYSEEDSLHERAKKALFSAERPFVVHEYIAIETITVLMQQLGKAAADIFVDTLLHNADYEMLYMFDTGFIFAASEFRKVKTKQLSFADSALLSLAEGYTVLTFDEALNRALKKKAVQ